jgi:hypothetical protein
MPRGRETVLPAWEIEELWPSRGSLIPDSQLCDLLAQKAADPIACLASPK